MCADVTDQQNKNTGLQIQFALRVSAVHMSHLNMVPGDRTQSYQHSSTVILLIHPYEFTVSPVLQDFPIRISCSCMSNYIYLTTVSAPFSFPHRGGQRSGSELIELKDTVGIQGSA